MQPSIPEEKPRRRRAAGSVLARFLFALTLLTLAAIVVVVVVMVQLWRGSGQQPTVPPIVVQSPGVTPTPSPTPSPTQVPTVTPTPDLAQRIDAYINGLTPAQQIGQLLMLSVYSNGYTTAFDQPLQHWEIANVIIFTHAGPQVMPPTLSGLTQLVKDLQGHAAQTLMVATDEEGGNVDRLAPYYGPTPSPQQLGASGDARQAYAQGQLDAERMLASGINTDLAPLADVEQGGALDPSRMFGSTPQQVNTYAGAFLDGLQQHGVIGTLKHWPGLGSAPANPDFGLPTITHSKAQLNAIDFASFRDLLARQPGMIMVTHAIVPAYDPKAPASLSPVLVDQVLRGQLGYQGVVITDAMDGGGLWQFMQQQGYTNQAQAIAEASVRAILAGDDIVECPIEPDRMTAVVTAVTAAVQSGRISQERLRESLRRIVALKVRMGLIKLP